MTYYKKILCLANSRKPPSGRCIAGREVLDNGFGGWIRPVSARPGREVSEEERWYKNGTDPQVMDILTIAFRQASPSLHQSENHLLHELIHWSKEGVASWESVAKSVEDPEGPLWLNDQTSSHGLNDRVAEADLAGINRSLYLIRPENLVLVTAEEKTGNEGTRRRVRAEFRLCGFDYRLVVTDPVVEGHCFSLPDGPLPVQNAVMCISLGELFHGFAYKLAASVISPNRNRGR